MSDSALHEFAALRATIQARGGARPWAFLAGLSAWAVLLAIVLIGLPNPIAAVVPLAVLLATFEVVRSLHLVVERIGRYIQVFFEETAGPDAALAPPAWERAAMIFGPALPGVGVHPFYLPVFLLTTVINMLAVVLPGPLTIELGALAVPHLAFVGWMIYCDRAMRRQRTTELARYRELKASGPR